MKQKRIVLFLIFLVTVMLFCIPGKSAYAKEDINNKLSKRYQEWLSLPEEERAKTIPPLPVNIKLEKQNTKNRFLNVLKATPIPERYDLRDDENISIEIKNQLQEGACWI